MRIAFSIFSLTCFLIALCSPALAENKTLTSEAAYIMGDGETPSFAEAMALQKAKQMALEEAGTYVESYTKVQNLNLSADEILTLTGGVIHVELLEQTRTLVGDGIRVWVKIKAVVTTDTMEELARRIKGKNVAEEYRDLRSKYEALTWDIDKLKQVIAKSSPAPEREAAIDRLRERERSFAELQRDEVTLFKRLVDGESLISQAKQVQSLSDSVIQSLLRSGYIIELGAIKSTLDREKNGQLSLELPVSIKIGATLDSSLRTAVQVRGGTEESVSVLSVESLNYGGFHQWAVNGTVGKKGRLRATLLGFPHTETTREELWHLRNRLEQIALVVEFFGEKTVLARCTTPFYRIKLIQPGINLGRKDQKIEDSDEWAISAEIDSSAQYFSSQKEYQEYTRLNDELAQARRRWSTAIKNQGKAQDPFEQYPETYKAWSTMKSNARKRWKTTAHARLVRIRIEDAARKESLDGVGHYLLIVNEQGVLPIKLTMDENMVGQIRKTTARLISDYKHPNAADLYSSDPEIRMRYSNYERSHRNWTREISMCDEQ